MQNCLQFLCLSNLFWSRCKSIPTPNHHRIFCSMCCPHFLRYPFLKMCSFCRSYLQNSKFFCVSFCQNPITIPSERLIHLCRRLLNSYYYPQSILHSPSPHFRNSPGFYFTFFIGRYVHHTFFRSLVDRNHSFLLPLQVHSSECF